MATQRAKFSRFHSLEERVEASRREVRSAEMARRELNLLHYRETCTMKTATFDELTIAVKMLLVEASRTHSTAAPNTESLKVRHIRSPNGATIVVTSLPQKRYDLSDPALVSTIASDVDKLMRLEESPLLASNRCPGSPTQRNPYPEESTEVLNYRYVVQELAKLRMWS